MSVIPLVIFARILRISVDFQGPDVRLDLMRILAVEWIALRGEIVQATTERPDVDLGGKLVLLAAFKDLWGRVIQMSAEALVFEQFLEVIWHADQIQLDLLVFQMNSCRVHISKDNSLIMNVTNAETELSEN